MKTIKRNIPNFITILNLVCGISSIIVLFKYDLIYSGILIFAGAIFDIADGLLARALNVTSEIGKQLDSFADMVTFGVAPGVLMYQLIDNQTLDIIELSYIAFLIPIFSSIRLSKFNIDNRQTTSFIGLPTPAAAIFIASLPIIIQKYNTEFSLNILIIITISLSLLLIAELPLFSLKIKKNEKLKSPENIIRIIFLFSSIILLFVFNYAAIPFIVILYIILSILNNLIKWNLKLK